MIDVNEIDRDVAVPHACFTRSGIADLDLLEAKNFRTTDTVETDGARHDQSSLLEAYARPRASARAARLIPKPRQIGTVASRAMTTTPRPRGRRGPACELVRSRSSPASLRSCRRTYRCAEFSELPCR